MIAAIVARNIRYPQDVNIFIIWQPSQRARSSSVESGTSTRQSVSCEHSSPKLTNHILLRVGRHGMRYAAAAPSEREALVYLASSTGVFTARRHGGQRGCAAARPRASLLCRGDAECTAMPGPAVGHSVECVQMLCAADREKGIVAKLAQSRRVMTQVTRES